VFKVIYGLKFQLLEIATKFAFVTSSSFADIGKKNS